MKIILADDHAIFRDSLEFMLNNKTAYQVIATVSSIQELRAHLNVVVPDLIVVDYHMPKGDTIAMADYLKKKYESLLVLFLTGSQSSLTLSHIIRSKADGIVHKEDAVDTIIDALGALEKGQSFISPTIQRKIIDDEFDLTGREFQVLSLVAQGYGSLEISDILGVSSRTVDKHKENIMQKMHVSNVAQLLVKAHHLELLSVECGLAKPELN